MKMSKIMVCVLSIIALSACKRDLTPQEQQQNEDYYKYQKTIAEIKVPQTEIVGTVQGNPGVFIHKFYDEKTGTNCYFINVNLDNMSCVK